MKAGDILCIKTTGELVVVLHVYPDEGKVEVRRPTMTRDNGIIHNAEVLLKTELETSEDHLRREANEMLIKEKIQNEFLEAHTKAEEAKVVAFKKPDLAVN